MKENLANDCQYCEKCGTCFIEAIGESCRCRVQLPDDDSAKELARQWVAGEVIF